MIIDSSIVLPGCLTTKAAGIWPASSSGYLQSEFVYEKLKPTLSVHLLYTMKINQIRLIFSSKTLALFIYQFVFVVLTGSQLHQQWLDVIAADLPVLLEQPACYSRH